MRFFEEFSRKLSRSPPRRNARSVKTLNRIARCNGVHPSLVLGMLGSKLSSLTIHSVPRGRLGPRGDGRRIFRPKSFSAKSFFGRTFFRPKKKRPKFCRGNFLGRKCFRPKTFWPKICWSKKFSAENFSAENFRLEILSADKSF